MRRSEGHERWIKPSCSLKPQKVQGPQLQADITNYSTHMEEEIGGTIESSEDWLPGHTSSPRPQLQTQKQGCGAAGHR